MTGLAAFFGVALLYVLVSRPLEGSALTAPMVFAGAGLLLSPLVLGLIEVRPESETVLVVAEVAFAIVVFTEAREIEVRRARRQAALVGRMVLVAGPLAIVAGTLAGALLLPGLGIIEAALLAVIVLPAEQAWSQAVLRSPRVPARVREALTLESGLADGLALLTLSALAGWAAGLQGAPTPAAGSWLLYGVVQIGGGVAVGAAVGLVGGGALRLAVRRGLVLPRAAHLAYLSLAVLALALALAIEANGFLAAFVAGLVVHRLHRSSQRPLHGFSDRVGRLLSLAVFFLLGLLAEALLTGGISPGVWAFALLALTAVRLVPMALATLGLRLPARELLVLGWYGPRGILTIVLGLILVTKGPDLEQAETIGAATILTVLLSVAAHGLTGPALARLFPAQGDRAALSERSREGH